MEKRQVIIVGGGIAGAASAWALVQAGVTNILLLERAAQPGVHSSGRNAAIQRSAIPNPVLHALARESTAFYAHPPQGFSSQPLVDPVGLFLTAPEGPDADSLSRWIQNPAYAEGAEEVDWSRVRQQHPYLQDLPARAWHFAEEGVLDVHAILHAFLHQAQTAGATVRNSCPVSHLLFDGSQVLGVSTPHGDFFADAILLAEGGWAGRLGPPNSTASQNTTSSFQVRRRHLVVSGVNAQVLPHAPIVWNLGADEFYFRPESGGLLLSACDHVKVLPEQGEVLDPDVVAQVAEKALRWLPGLENLTAAYAWSGMRTFPEQEGFQIGPDAQWGGLFWAAGLGGHGMTCAPAVGRLAARLLLEGGTLFQCRPAVTSLDT